jgi:hypothetical protein
MGRPSKWTEYVRVAGVVLVASAWACAGGSKGHDGSYGVYDEGGDDDDTGATTFASVDDGDDPQPADDDGVDSGPPDLGACQGDGDCLSPPGTCWGSGQCVDGQCQLLPLPEGSPCDDGDPCSDPDFCNAQGDCIADTIPCTAPNASGGSCIAGACQGLTCNAGFGNCNDDWGDGCELALDTATDCGGCGMPCVAGAHATADCSSGTCNAACEDPWTDCDGDISNGCEVPEGVPNQCDAGGLNPNGCWTAWCGSSNVAGAVNFGTWYCMECSTCHVPGNGLCQWCNHDTGTWYPAEQCPCGTWEDLTCG